MTTLGTLGQTDMQNFDNAGDLNTTLASIEEKEKSEATEKLLKKVGGYIEESRTFRTRQESKWIDSIRYWRGEQWMNRKQRKRRGKGWTEAVVNRVLPIIEQQIAMMTDNNPRGKFLPKEQSDQQFTKDIESLVMWRAKRLNMRQRLIKGCHNSKIFGFQVMKVFWDDSLMAGPDVNSRLIPPNHFIMDPHATDVEDAEYMGTERLVSLEYAIQRWPEKTKELRYQASGTESESLSPVGDTNSLDAELGHTSTRDSIAPDAQIQRPMVKLVELYYRDYTKQEYEIAVPMDILKEDGTVVENAGGQWVYAESGELHTIENNPTTTSFEPIYPNGRVTVLADKVILEDGPVNGLWPFAIGINTPIPGRWYGMSEVEQLEGRQDVINTEISKIEDHSKLAVHTRRKVEVGAVANPKSIVNTPDALILMNPGRMKGLEWEQPPQMSTDVWNLIQFSERDMENASGMSGPSMGRQTEGRKTATEISVLERAGRGRVGMVSALLDEFISRVFMLMGQVIQQNYDEGKIIRVLGEDGQESSVTIVGGHKTVEYDVEVEMGSTLPYDKELRKADAMALYGVLELAYLPELLEAYEVKNIQEVLQRHQLYMLFIQYAEVLMNPEVQRILEPYVQQLQLEQGGQGEQR